MTTQPAPTSPPESSDLTIAIRVAQKMLVAYSDTSSFGEFGYAQAHGALSESLRILLHALGAETDSRSEGWTATMAVRLPGVEAPEPLYGGDVDQFVSDAYDSLADSDLDDETGEGQ